MLSATRRKAIGFSVIFHWHLGDMGFLVLVIKLRTKAKGFVGCATKTMHGAQDYDAHCAGNRCTERRKPLHGAQAYPF